jgi:hypothetical protein
VVVTVLSVADVILVQVGELSVVLPLGEPLNEVEL